MKKRTPIEESGDNSGPASRVVAFLSFTRPVFATKSDGALNGVTFQKPGCCWKQHAILKTLNPNLADRGYAAFYNDRLLVLDDQADARHLDH